MNMTPLWAALRSRLLNRPASLLRGACNQSVRQVVVTAMVTAACTTQAGAAQPVQPSRPTSAAEVMYLVLVGEMQVAAKEAGIGYSLLLEAGRKSGDADVYRRAVNVALESRSGDAAKEAARAWATTLPLSPDPYRVLLQLMLASNEVAQSGAPLEKLLKLEPDAERNTLIEVVVQTYARAKDKLAARQVAAAALQPWTQRPDTAAGALAAQGLLALNVGLKDAALALLRDALSAPAGSGAPGYLAVELLKAKVAETEPLLQTYLAHTAGAPQNIRMAYVRHLLDNNRTADAEKQLETAVAQTPTAAEPWLLLGAMALQKGELTEAEDRFKRFLTLSNGMDPERAQRGHVQAYLSLAQIAETRQQFDVAEAWLDRIETRDDELRVQVRRATLLAKQGKVAEARALIQQIPEQQPADARMKLLAEVQLLKDAQQPAEAFAVLGAATEQYPEDEELAYEQAMLADKLGRPDEMERILRLLMARKPDYHHAYNALGYALADRNTRLDEAKALILKALEMAPGDPFITDSLGWVEYRLGNLPRAAQLLRQAFEKRPDVEIGVHLGEVLWVMGERETAKTVFLQAKGLQADNAVLVETLKRLGVML